MPGRPRRTAACRHPRRRGWRRRRVEFSSRAAASSARCSSSPLNATSASTDRPRSSTADRSACGEAAPVGVVEIADRDRGRARALGDAGDGDHLQRVARDRPEEQPVVGIVVERQRGGGRRAGQDAGRDRRVEIAERDDRRRRADDRVDTTRDERVEADRRRRRGCSFVGRINSTSTPLTPPASLIWSVASSTASTIPSPNSVAPGPVVGSNTPSTRTPSLVRAGELVVVTKDWVVVGALSSSPVHATRPRRPRPTPRNRRARRRITASR